MPKKWSSFSDTSYTSFTSNNNENLVVFIHGLTDNNSIEYWEPVATLLRGDSNLNSHDYLYLRYGASKGLFPNFLKLLKGRRKISTFPEISKFLTRKIVEIHKMSNTKQILIYGHSYGGLLAIDIVHNILSSDSDSIIVAGICVDATPVKPHRLARALNAIGLGGNPLLSHISHERNFNTVLANKLSVVRESGVYATYFHSIHDELFSQMPNGFEFDEIIPLARSHKWFNQVPDRWDDNYKELTKWLELRSG